MGSRLFWRRSATALGIYGSTALGILGSLVVFRVLGPTGSGRFSIVVGAAAFFQLLLELTSDEALVKYGFRYAAREDWGRFHHLFRIGLRLKLAGGRYRFAAETFDRWGASAPLFSLATRVELPRAADRRRRPPGSSRRPAPRARRSGG